MPQISVSRPNYRPVLAAQSPQESTRAIVHVVGCEETARDLLGCWLARVNIETRGHATLEACLASAAKTHLGCVLADAACLTEAAPTACAQLPVVATAIEADPAIVVRAIKSGALDFIRRPLQETEVLTAINAALAVDRQRRSAALRDDLVRDCFQSLSPRERQVMAFVTAGKLNKQVAGV